MKKLDLFTATRSFSDEVAMFTLKSLWKSEYKKELEAELGHLEDQIRIWSDVKGNTTFNLEDDEIDAHIADLRETQKKCVDAFNTVCNEWTRYEYSDAAKKLYKDWSHAMSNNAKKQAFVDFLAEYNLAANYDTELVTTLFRATLGDSSGSNMSQLCKSGKAAVETRKRTEFLKIVYRRLFDAMTAAGTIKFDDFTLKSGTLEYECAVEIPPLTKAYYEAKKKGKK